MGLHLRRRTGITALLIRITCNFDRHRDKQRVLDAGAAEIGAKGQAISDLTGGFGTHILNIGTASITRLEQYASQSQSQFQTLWQSAASSRPDFSVGEPVLV